MATQNPTLAGSSQALDTSLPTIYSEFLLLRDETGVMRNVSTMYTLEPNSGTTKNLINYGRVVAYNVADGADITQSQALSDFNTTYTPSEVAVQVTLAGSTMRRVQDTDLLQRTGRILNKAYDLKEDSDGTAQFTSFSSTDLGSASTVLSPGIIAAAAAQLRVGISIANPEPAPEPLICVLHPLSAVPLAGRIVPLTDVPTGTTIYGTDGGAHAGLTLGVGGTSSAGERILKGGLKALGEVAGSGMAIHLDANVDATTAGTDAATNCAFAKEGMVYVSELEPRLVPDTSDVSMRDAVELNLWGSYVWGVYRAANYGVSIVCDASLPTS